MVGIGADQIRGGAHEDKVNSSTLTEVIDPPRLKQTIQLPQYQRSGWKYQGTGTQARRCQVQITFSEQRVKHPVLRH